MAPCTPKSEIEDGKRVSSVLATSLFWVCVFGCVVLVRAKHTKDKRKSKETRKGPLPALNDDL